MNIIAAIIACMVMSSCANPFKQDTGPLMFSKQWHAQERVKAREARDRYRLRKAVGAKHTKDWEAYSELKTIEQDAWLASHPECAKYDKRTNLRAVKGKACASVGERGAEAAERCIPIKFGGYSGPVNWVEVRREHAECEGIPIVASVRSWTGNWGEDN